MPWLDNDLTTIAGGDPTGTFASAFGYTTSLDGEGPCARVVYVSRSGHVHELSLVSGRAWADNDLTAITNGPRTVSSPFGYTTSIGGQGPCARVVYRSDDGHVHELSLVSGRRWADNDLTAITGGDPIFGPLFGYTTSLDRQGPCARVVYTALGHVHELSLVA